MCKTNTKRGKIKVLSALLSIALLFSLIPAVSLFPLASAAYVAPTTSAIYKFYKNAYSTDNTATNPKTTPFLDYLGDRKWAYVADTVPAVNSSLGLLSTSMQIDPDLNGYVALKISIPATGQYQASIKYYAKARNALTKLYYIPYSSESTWDNENIPNYFNSTYLKGELDMSQGTPNTYVTASLMDVTLNEGDYLLVFRAEGSSDTVPPISYTMSPNTLTLTGSILSSAVVDAKDLLGVGEKTSIKVSGTMSSGNAAILKDAAITYSSSNPSIASVNETTGVITAVAPGSADITATVTQYGTTVTSSAKTIKIVSAPSHGALRISVSDPSGSSLNGINIAKDASTPDFTQNQQDDFDVGTTFNITAPTVVGKTFLYWKNATSKRVVTTSRNCSFKIGSNTYLTAVYKDTVSGGVLVEFVDKNNKVLQSTILNGTTTSTIAPTPFSIGYDFQNWASGSLNVSAGDTVTSDIIEEKDTTFIAQYNKSADQYTVTVTGSTTDGTNAYSYDDKISLTAAAPPEGQEFAYWTRDGQITSYSPTYSFYVWDNTNVAAVFAPTGEAIPAVPQIMMDKAKTDTGRIIFSSERTVPDGYELIESGILLTNDGMSAASSTFSLETSGIIKAIMQSDRNDGQFTVRKDNISGTWYARAYLIYKDTSAGQFRVIYSNIVNGTEE